VSGFHNDEHSKYSYILRQVMQSICGNRQNWNILLQYILNMTWLYN